MGKLDFQCTVSDAVVLLPKREIRSGDTKRNLLLWREGIRWLLQKICHLLLLLEVTGQKGTETRSMCSSYQMRD